MTTLRDAVLAITALVKEVDILLQMDTAKAAPAIAKELGAESKLADALDTLIDPLKTLQPKLHYLRDLSQQTGGLRGLLGLLQPLSSTAVALARLLKQQSAGSDLDAVMLPLTGIANGLGGFDDVVKGGESLLDGLPQPADIDGVIAGVESLVNRLAALKKAPPPTMGKADGPDR